eukprot:71167_1
MPLKRGKLGRASKSMGNLYDIYNDRNYQTLHRSLSFSTLLKTQTEYLTKIPDDIVSYRPFILDGYLDVEHVDNACWSTLSILSGLHNETVNIYTHLIPCILIIIKLYSWYTHGIHENILYFYGITMALCFLTSTYYHIGCCRRPTNYRNFLQIDLFGIFCVFFASVLAGMNCCYSCHPKLQFVYSITNIIIFCFVLFPILFLFPEKTSFRLKRNVFGSLLALELIPTAHWIYLYNYSINDWSLIYEFWYAPLGMFGGYFTGGIIWHFRIPERFYPGKFNIFGHSHQIWHLFIVLASFCWFYGLYDMRVYHNNNVCYAYT